MPAANAAEAAQIEKPRRLRSTNTPLHHYTRIPPDRFSAPARKNAPGYPEDKPMKLRVSQDRLKVEHSIIEGLRPVLERLLAATPEIRSIIPGVIRVVRDARGPVKIRVTVPTTNGWKAIALSAGSRQELFISTALSRDALGAAIGAALG